MAVCDNTFNTVCERLTYGGVEYRLEDQSIFVNDEDLHSMHWMSGATCIFVTCCTRCNAQDPPMNL